MTTYSAISAPEIAQDAPGTQPLFQKLRDNPIAISEGEPGAPKIALSAIERPAAGTTVRISKDSVTNVASSGAATNLDLIIVTFMQVGVVRFSGTFRNAVGSADALFLVLRTRNGATTTMFTSSTNTGGGAVTETYDASILPGDVWTVRCRNSDATGTAEFTNMRIQTNGENIWQYTPPSGSGGAITISNTYT